MGLPWVRFDTNTPAHDKILALLSDPSPKRWQAVASWHFSVEWSGGAGTDGVVPRAALPWIHGTDTTARLLVKHKLWTEESVTGWRIRNFEKYQLLNEYAEALQETRRYASAKANCKRWHGAQCWADGKGCSRDQ